MSVGAAPFVRAAPPSPGPAAGAALLEGSAPPGRSAVSAGAPPLVRSEPPVGSLLAVGLVSCWGPVPPGRPASSDENRAMFAENTQRLQFCNRCKFAVMVMSVTCL